MSSAATAGQTQVSPDCSDTGIPNFCHLDVSQVTDFSASLQQALQTITEAALSCEYTLPTSTVAGQTVDPNSLNVIYSVNGDSSQELLVAQTDSTCSVGNGWYFDATGKIVLCPETCSTIQQDPNAILRILGGCQTISIVN